MSAVLKADNSRELVRYVSKLTVRKIHTTHKEAGELQVALDYLRNKLKGLREAQADTKELAYIERKGKDLAAKLEALNPQPTIYELVNYNEDAAIADITLLIIDLTKSFQVGKLLSVSQIEQLAMTILTRMSALTLDDIALCFYRAKCGDYGQVYDRLDLNVINGWLNAYKKEREEMAAFDHQNKHIASKEGMSYDPRDMKSVNRVARDRGVPVDDDTYYQEFKARVLEKRKQSK